MTGLRARLLTGFALVAIPPLLILAATMLLLVRRSFEAAARERQESGLRTVEARLLEMRQRAEAQIATIASRDVPEALAKGTLTRALARDIASRRDLPALEIVDEQGRVVSSAHREAGFGLPDRDGLFPGDSALRIESVGSGYGEIQRLALMPERRVTGRGEALLVRGGPFLDGDFLADVGRLMGVEVAFHDRLRERWFARPGSELLGSAPAPPDSGGPNQPVVLGGAPYRWSAVALNPALALVVATPSGALETLTGGLVRLTLVLAATSLGAALLAAWALSARFSRPIGELAQAARRVAAGDLEGSLAVRGHDETAELARAFNAMTHDLKASNERLVQAERVAAWREIAQRLAHELKKPLFPIQISLETLQRSADRAPADRLAALLRDSMGTMLEELRSLRGIVDEFSQFARMPQPRLRPTDLGVVVEQVLSLYRDRAAHVAVETDLQPGLPRTAADPDLLARALSNLVANALEAMPNGGTLRLRTLARDGEVALAVSDTGPGLTEEQRRRLFTPYYTTKKGGTGLGLAIAQGIVADQGGRVEVAGEEGRGTTFTIVLPGRAP